MRVLVAGIGRFAAPPGALGAADAVDGASYADEILTRYAGSLSALGGFLAAAADSGLDVLPMSVVSTGSATDADRDTVETLRTRIFSELRGWKVDAAYLALDGALRIAEPFAAPGSDALERATATASATPAFAEVDLLQSLHTRLGPHVPLAATTDVEPDTAVAAALETHTVVRITPADLPDGNAAARGAAAARRLAAHLLPTPPTVIPSEARDQIRMPTAAATGVYVPPDPALALRMTAQTPTTQLVLPEDPAPAAAAGECVPLDLHVTGLAGRTVSVGWFICDELGDVRWDLRESREVSDSAPLRFAWPVQPADPPGVYSLRAMVWSPELRWQGIVSGTIEVVDPTRGARASSARFPAVPRDRLLAPRAELDAASPPQLEALFRAAEPACRTAHNADGSWGSPSRDRRGAHHIAIYYRTAETALAYLQAYHLFGDETFAAEARRGLDFLVETQLPNGGWCEWSFTWVTPQWVFLREACFYDTGSVARTLLEGHRTLGDERYLRAVSRAADYALTAPYTGNNNYDAFLLWYLAPYAVLSGEPRCLEHAVARCRDAVLPGQQPYGGFPAHNLSTGYQAIIAYGLLALLQALPAEHAYRLALRRATLMALNFLIWLQDARGEFYAGWEYDRTFGVTPDGQPRGTTTSPANGRLVEVFRTATGLFDLDPRVYNAFSHSVARRATTRARGTDLLALTSLLTWRHVK